MMKPDMCKHPAQEPTHEPPRSPQPDKPEQTLAAAKQPYDRLFNFSAGPAVLPLPVLERAQAELLNYQVHSGDNACWDLLLHEAGHPASAQSSYAYHYDVHAWELEAAPHMLQGSGSSVMEMSHRGKEFTNIINKAEADLRQLLGIPDNYEVSSHLLVNPPACSAVAVQKSLWHLQRVCHTITRGLPHHLPRVLWQVLFMQGGASAQFAAVPLNLTQPGQQVACACCCVVTSRAWLWDRLRSMLMHAKPEWARFLESRASLRLWITGGPHCDWVVEQEGGAGGGQVLQRKHCGEGRQQVSAPA